MASKILTLTAAATGYVLGARAGRDRYETIKSKAEQFVRNPRVRKAASDAQDVAAEKAPGAGQKVKDLAGKVKGKASSSDDESSSNKANGKKSASDTSSTSAGAASSAKAPTSGPSTSSSTPGTGTGAATGTARTGTAGTDANAPGAPGAGKHA